MKKYKKYEPLVVVLMGILIHFIFFIMSPDNIEGKRIYDHVMDTALTVLITFLVWYGAFAIDRQLDKRFPWDQYTGQHILFQIIFISLYTSTVIFVLSQAYHTFVCEARGTESPIPEELSIFLGVLIAFLVTAIHTGSSFFLKWKNSLLEVERYKKESIEAQYETLKNQVNPHFLFNSFSVLSSLISIDQQKAEEFVNRLSSVYRYTLDNYTNELVSVGEELDFIRSYIFLLKTRFGDNLVVHLEVPDTAKDYYILPMSLQLLIENAVKHNVISNSKPLTVTIGVKGDNLVVNNNLQLRTDVCNSTRIGLQNIKDRYTYFTDREVVIVNDEKAFIVKLPMLTINE